MNNPAECYIVICRLGEEESEVLGGEYALATRRTFATREDAQKYASGVSPSREPIVVFCMRGVTREAEAAAILKVVGSPQTMANALSVFILDRQIHAWLKEHYPKALEQAINAVNEYDPGQIEGKIPKIGPSFAVPHEFEPTEPDSETCGVCGKYKGYEKFHGVQKLDTTPVVNRPHSFKKGDVVRVRSEMMNRWPHLRLDHDRIVIKSRLNRHNDSGYPLYRIEGDLGMFTEQWFEQVVTEQEIGTARRRAAAELGLPTKLTRRGNPA